MGVEAAKKWGIEKVKSIGETATSENNLADYYLRACRYPHVSLFSFERQYPVEFMKFFGYDHVAVYFTTSLRKAIGDELVEEYRARSIEYLSKDDGATFCILHPGKTGIKRWSIKVDLIEGESPSNTISRFKDRLEFFTGVKIATERLTFYTKNRNNTITSEEEVVLHAVRERIFFEIRSRPGYPQTRPQSFFDLVPMVAKVINSGMLLFPLVNRFRIWTTVWGTAGLIKKLVEANPNFLEKARTLGVDENIFNEVLDHPIPSNPATELIPLELLEAVCLVRGLVACMNVHEMIEDNAGYNLEMIDVYDTIQK